MGVLTDCIMLFQPGEENIHAVIFLIEIRHDIFPDISVPPVFVLLISSFLHDASGNAPLYRNLQAPTKDH